MMNYGLGWNSSQRKTFTSPSTEVMPTHKARGRRRRQLGTEVGGGGVHGQQEFEV